MSPVLALAESGNHLGVAFAAKSRSRANIHDRYRHVLIASATGYSSHCLMSSTNDIIG
jgi:hypothetical protein